MLCSVVFLHRLSSSPLLRLSKNKNIFASWKAALYFGTFVYFLLQLFTEVKAQVRFGRPNRCTKCLSGSISLPSGLN